MKIAEIETIFDRLVELYPDKPLAVAIACDDILDRTGALLGKVRVAVGIKKDNQTFCFSCGKPLTPHEQVYAKQCTKCLINNKKGSHGKENT